MISNERPFPYGRQPYDSQFRQPRPPVVEDTLKSGGIQIERKTFSMALKENPRGRFLRITESTVESTKPHFASVIIPATGLQDFQKLLADMVKAAGEIPAKKESPHLN